MHLGQEVTLYWDFTGADAQGTAIHFAQHLSDFLKRSSIPDQVSSTFANEDGSWVVSWKAAPHAALAVGRILRPQRYDGVLPQD